MNDTPKRRKRAPSRDTSSGQFEAASPLTDPDLMDFALRIVRAITVLEEPLAALALSLDCEGSAKASAFVGAFLASLKDSMLQELAADPDSLKDAKKKRLEAKRLGNMSLEEQQRVQAVVADWMALPSAAARVLRSNKGGIGAWACLADSAMRCFANAFDVYSGAVRRGGAQ